MKTYESAFWMLAVIGLATGLKAQSSDPCAREKELLQSLQKQRQLAEQALTSQSCAGPARTICRGPNRYTAIPDS
jgi:hypothetical protein